MITIRLMLWCVALGDPGSTEALNDSPRYFEIQVVDAQTGRGIPLVELTTVDQVSHVTDNAGRVAYFEPGHAGQTIYFALASHGYEIPKDGFGMPGVQLRIQPGGKEIIRLQRLNLAERLYRVTGQGLYRDTVLLGKSAPLREPLGSGKVAGQDSVGAVPYGGKIWWFWGDTLRLSYPLGHFRMAGATTKPADELDPARGIDFDYFVDEDGFSRPMAEIPDQPGVVWLDGFATAPGGDPSETREILMAGFSRRPGLAEAFEQGIMTFNDERGVFEKANNVPLDSDCQLLHGHPIPLVENGTEYLAFGRPFPVTRVKRQRGDILRPGAYEGWSCMGEDGQPVRTEDGRLDWQWRRSAPVTQTIEFDWLKKGLIEPSEARFLPLDSNDPFRHVVMHGGTIRWNEHRRRWVMVAVEMSMDRDSPSLLGEVWYSESTSPQGPWTKAVKVVTHDHQSFYNPCHHQFLDREGGRWIHFEGTYSNTFTQSRPTLRYNYNQVMYRLDLDHPSLIEAFSR